jgi:RNA-directed DNA polymerase
MLAPQPGRTGRAPRPVKILSKTALLNAWRSSRDSSPNAGRPGSDNVSARQFGAKLDANLDHIVHQLREGRYGFSKLHVVFIPKPKSDTERVICIPTVRDRLVQRAIGEYLTSRSVFPIENSSSFGFIKGLGPKSAIERALELREKYDWCLKTDIKSFFDQISRPILKAKVAQALKGNSLQPLIFDVIDCEVKLKTQEKDKLQRRGIIYGLGIRQGMPLSPLLANLALAEFDAHVEGRNIKMVRYADDWFYSSEQRKRREMDLST